VAAARGDTDEVRRLVRDGGAAVDETDRLSASTPLHYAAACGHVETARCLVRELGADVEALVWDDWSAVHVAAEAGNVAMLRFLVRECGCGVGGTDVIGLTSLHLAAEHGHVEAVRVLVEELGADPTARSKSGKLPATIAARDGYVDVLRYFAHEAPPGSLDVQEAAQTTVERMDSGACQFLLSLDARAARAGIAKGVARGGRASPTWCASWLGYPVTAADVQMVIPGKQDEARQWLDSAHPLQHERRAAEAAPRHFPAALARLVGDFVPRPDGAAAAAGAHARGGRGGAAGQAGEARVSF